MEEIKDPSPEYIKAFNQGYRLRQFEPKLLDQVLSSDQKSESFNAIKAGKKQFELEQLREQTKKDERNRGKER